LINFLLLPHVNLSFAGVVYLLYSTLLLLLTTLLITSLVYFSFFQNSIKI